MLSHARALLASDPQGVTAYVQADIRDTEKVLAGAARNPRLRASRSRSWSLMILQYVPDADDPWGIIRRVLEPLAPGSYLTVSDTDRRHRLPRGWPRARPSLNARMPTNLILRSRREFERFFDGLEMVEPGVVPLPEWRAVGSVHPILLLPCLDATPWQPSSSLPQDAPT